jgi:two-component system phosphate regulon response regulator PhoB
MPRPLVLVLEDEPDVALLLRMVCDLAGCDATLAATLGEGRACLASLPHPAIVLLDLALSGGDAYEFCREVTRRHPGLRVLIVSADVHATSEADAVAVGAEGFVAKPFEPEALAAQIGRLVRSAA